MSINRDSGALASMQPGDVLVSHSTAVHEYEIGIVPNAPHAVFPTHDAALSAGRAEAAARGVDAWVTEDRTHVVRIARHRPKDQATAG